MIRPKQHIHMSDYNITLFKAARLMTLTPNLSALRMASSICLLMPWLANGKKYCISI
ncbi:hypothetical protein HanRHA438_Chr06g0271921 [Helianthus annuus]|nr:hypothetical protein HanRHA438_Chr06g0271921 [Helianthus annuus]